MVSKYSINDNMKIIFIIVPLLFSNLFEFNIFISLVFKFSAINFEFFKLCVKFMFIK